jgi:hypothetical protein
LYLLRHGPLICEGSAPDAPHCCRRKTAFPANRPGPWPESRQAPLSTGPTHRNRVFGAIAVRNKQFCSANGGAPTCTRFGVIAARHLSSTLATTLLVGLKPPPRTEGLLGLVPGLSPPGRPSRLPRRIPTFQSSRRHFAPRIPEGKAFPNLMGARRESRGSSLPVESRSDGRLGASLQCS